MSTTAQDSRILPVGDWSRHSGYLVCSTAEHRIEVQPVPDDDICLIKIPDARADERYDLEICGQRLGMRRSLDYPGHSFVKLDQISPAITGKHPLSLVITPA